MEIRPPRHHVDRRFVLWRTLQALFWGVGVLGVLGVIWLRAEPARPWIGPPWVILAVVYAINVVVMPTWRYRVHRWEATDDTLYALEGWLSRTWRVVPVSRIQSIDTEAGPLQQMLGIATVKVTTASHEGGVTVEGLDAAVARDTVDRLREVTAATPGDAT